MHEAGLMQDALETALVHAGLHQARRIHRITLNVGDMSGVVPEALQMAFAAAKRGTLADQALLVIQRIPVICDCPYCRREFQPSDVIYLCPGCGQILDKARQGREIELASLEVS